MNGSTILINPLTAPGIPQSENETVNQQSLEKQGTSKHSDQTQDEEQFVQQKDENASKFQVNESLFKGPQERDKLENVIPTGVDHLLFASTGNDTEVQKLK